MRTALAILVGFALALAARGARAEPPRAAARLDYSRGEGAATCPDDGSLLRALVAARLGYDPFERTDGSERFVVVISARVPRRWSAHVERYNAAGARMVDETFPEPPIPGDCEALFSPLASYVRALFLTGPTATDAPEPKPEPAASPPPPPPPAPAEKPSKPPEPPEVPNPARTVASRVAIVSYVATGVFLGLGIAWTVVAQNKGDTAQALAAQAHAGSYSACMTGGVQRGYCDRLLNAWQSRDTAVGLRNGWLAAAGLSGAIGIAATFWTLSLPATIKGQPQAQIALVPGGLIIRGSF